MDGFIMIANCRRGPNPSPVRNANPRSMPIRMPRFFPLSGVINSPRARPAPSRENINPPPCRRVVKGERKLRLKLPSQTLLVLRTHFEVGTHITIKFSVEGMKEIVNGGCHCALF